MDVDANPEVSQQLGIQAIPTLMVFKDGKVLDRLVGPHPARLKGEIDRVLVSAEKK